MLRDLHNAFRCRLHRVLNGCPERFITSRVLPEKGKWTEGGNLSTTCYVSVFVEFVKL